MPFLLAPKGGNPSLFSGDHQEIKLPSANSDKNVS